MYSPFKHLRPHLPVDCGDTGLHTLTRDLQGALTRPNQSAFIRTCGQNHCHQHDAYRARGIDTHKEQAQPANTWSKLAHGSPAPSRAPLSPVPRTLSSPLLSHLAAGAPQRLPAHLCTSGLDNELTFSKQPLLHP